MTIEQAQKIVGNQPMFALRHMRGALNTLTHLNDTDDKTRLIAACKVLKVRKYTDYEKLIM